MHAFVAHDRGIVDQDKVRCAVDDRTNHATVKEFVGCDGNIDVGDEQEKPKGLQEGVSTEVLGTAFDAGEEENKQEKDEDVDWSDILEGKTREAVEILGDAHVKGEVWIEEGKELKVFIIRATGEDHHGGLRIESE